MTNLYKLTKNNNTILFVGSIHNQNFTQFPSKWKNILIEYEPDKLFMELGGEATEATDLKLPTKEYLAHLGFAIESCEESAFDKLSSFEKMFIISHSVKYYDKQNIN